MGFEYRQQDLVIQYDANPLIPQRVAGASADQHLNVNRLMSNAQVTVLQSPTSSSLAQVGPQQVILRTNFFGEFTSPAATDLRRQYLLAKISRLLNLLTDSDARLKFLGLVTILRCPVRERPAQIVVRQRVAEHIPGLSLLAGTGAPVDMLARATHVRDETRFCSVQLGWYQERSVFFQLPEGAPIPHPMNDWEMPITDEGLELRYDQNNKYALYGGRREWSREDFMNLADCAISEASVDLSPFLFLAEGV